MSTIDGSTITVQLSQPVTSGTNWQPIEGQETTELLQHFGSKLDADARQSLVESTANILGRCVPPSGADEANTGLVVGYVQSGKTMSFTTLAAMAADNGYPLIIVITGTTDLLFNQSAQRLEKDLRMDSRGDRKWQHFKEPTTTDRARLHEILEDWRDPSVPMTERQIALITIKKNWSVLRKLVTLLNSLDRSGIPALIIDDEADQASLNTRVRQNSESTTYTRLKQLRNLFPRHSFIQYTATPQANLLISILDVLSPDYAELLLPGEDYTGGIEFFGERQPHIRIIPASQAPSRQNPVTDLPESLIDAMRVFFIGVSAGYVLEQTNRSNRTMLIHPSRETDPHSDYATWARSLVQSWKDVLSLEDSDADKQELLAEFEVSYQDIASTVGCSMPTWDAIQARLRTAVRRTHIEVVNRTAQGVADIAWRDNYSWILVGGQKLDRGFTVEGLTVTYMPRGLGMGNADTLQQRGRFFGYKRSYLGYCRIYLESDSVDAFTDYVIHEENVRRQLEEFRSTNLPMSQWKRAFLMPSGMQPTRRNVLAVDHLRDSFSDDWFWVRTPHQAEESVVANRITFDSYTGQKPFEDLPDSMYGAAATRHQGLVGTSLREVYDELLIQVSVVEDEDTQRYYGAMLQIQHYLEQQPDELCDVYFLNPDDDSRRAVDPVSGQIENVFQGSNRQPNDPQYYPGDRPLHGTDRLTVHLRRLELTESGTVIASDVPVLAVWIPAKMAQAWLVQNGV